MTQKLLNAATNLPARSKTRSPFLEVARRSSETQFRNMIFIILYHKLWIFLHPQSLNQVSGTAKEKGSTIADMIYSIVQILDDTRVSTLVRSCEFVWHNQKHPNTKPNTIGFKLDICELLPRSPRSFSPKGSENKTINGWNHQQWEKHWWNQWFSDLHLFVSPVSPFLEFIFQIIDA